LSARGELRPGDGPSVSNPQQGDRPPGHISKVRAMGREKEALASRAFRCVAHRHTDDVAVLVADHRAIQAAPARDIDPFRHVPVPTHQCRPVRRVLRLRHSDPTIERPMKTVNSGWVRSIAASRLKAQRDRRREPPNPRTPRRAHHHRCPASHPRFPHRVAECALGFW